MAVLAGTCRPSSRGAFQALFELVQPGPLVVAEAVGYRRAAYAAHAPPSRTPWWAGAGRRPSSCSCRRVGRSGEVLASGSRTEKTVPFSLVVRAIVPEWRRSTMRRALSSRSPVPPPIRMGGEEGLEDPRCDGRRDARTAVADLDEQLVAVARRGSSSAPDPPIASAALGMRLVQTGLSSAACTAFELRERSGTPWSPAS